MGDVGVPEVFEITLGLISLRAARVQLEFEWASRVAALGKPWWRVHE